VRGDSSIQEVILSGGEPFIVSDDKLAHYMQTLEEIPHVNLIRFHTRMLVTLPTRMCESFFEAMRIHRAKKVIVLHANHPRELHPVLLPAFERLRHMGVTLLNQSVLLKGVNDDVDVLERLSRALFQYGVLPYYLHQLDPVIGAEHFLVSAEQGRVLHKQLKARCPGYLVPRYVAEIPSLPYKETMEQPTANA
jgi:KamA family protein